jgi:hypothetical protein
VAQGDWDIDEFLEPKQFVVFICATILMPLVLLNLLIALMGDTYSKV